VPDGRKPERTAPRKPAGAALRAFSLNDAGVLIGAPLLLGLAWLAPERHWPSIARSLSPLAISGLTKDAKATAEAIRQMLGARLPGLSPHHVLRDMASEGILTFLQILKSHRPDRWEPAVRLVNFERVTMVRQSGRGVILWVAHGFHGHLGAKVAFRRAGLDVSHLSRGTHGFSESRFGVRYLNGLQASVEDRYLAERILLPLEGSNSTATNLIVRRLRANGVVSITAQRGTGRTVDARLLDGILPLAPGAAVLARKTGAALLPVFAFRNDTGVIEVSVEPPIATDAGVSRDQAVAETVRRYAAILEPYVLRYPGQWLGWSQL